jgi:hypothetical protein
MCLLRSPNDGRQLLQSAVVSLSNCFQILFLASHSGGASSRRTCRILNIA